MLILGTIWLFAMIYMLRVLLYYVVKFYKKSEWCKSRALAEGGDDQIAFESGSEQVSPKKVDKNTKIMYI